MKALLFLYITIASASSDYQQSVLNDWVEAHNSGDKIEFEAFIRNHYPENYLNDTAIERQLNFYLAVRDDFGSVNPIVYETALESETKLIVHFVREGISNAATGISLADILEVEIDIDPEKNKLARGLGLGALICSRN